MQIVGKTKKVLLENFQIHFSHAKSETRVFGVEKVWSFGVFFRIFEIKTFALFSSSSSTKDTND